jgi:hypothetical protein
MLSIAIDLLRSVAPCDEPVLLVPALFTAFIRVVFIVFISAEVSSLSLPLLLFDPLFDPQL